MGFGKFLLGGVCAVGAVIAAPVVVPAAGLALATTSMVGTGAASAAAFTAGVGMYTASSAAAATVAGVAAGAAGVAAGAAQEKKLENAYNKGRNDGIEEASKIYETKLREQYDAFMAQIKNIERDKAEYEALINEYETYIDDLNRQLTYERGNTAELRKELGLSAKELSRLRGLRQAG